METSYTGNFRSKVGKIMRGLVVAALIGSVGVAPAIGKDDHKRMGKYDNGRYKQKGHGYDRGHSAHGRRVYQTNVYREQVYVPPPVIYAPPPPPGISIFFPPIFIHP
jgi:hypothetical protein